MSNDNHREPNEARLAALLRAIDADAPPPDAAMLAAIGQRAAAAFAESSGLIADALDETQTNQPTQPEIHGNDRNYGKNESHDSHTSHSSHSPTATTPVQTTTTTGAAPAPRRNTMFTFAIKGLVGLLASTAALIAWFSLSPPNSAVGATQFSEVLAELREAKTLQLRVSKGGGSADVWVRAPGLVRREESPQRYQISAGSRLWRIDESQNTAVSEDSPWFISPEKQIDLLGLLEVGVTDATALLTARPVERVAREGRDCFIYRVELPAKAGQLQIEAAADAKTLQLLEITAREAGDRRKAGPPLAELQLVALDVVVDDDKFIVAKSLTEDGRIGKISQAQGIVVLRPMLAKRWTPICRDTLLKPGDWVRTEIRGANAVKLTLSTEVELTLGPGTLVECVSPTQARVHNGAVQVMSPKQDKPDPADTFTLLAPRSGSRIFKPGDKHLVRVDRDEKLVDVPKAPVWLAGFEGTSNNESLGSLIVEIDGRNEPLTVGYHKVSVEIRDQIARTTIEESFVNHTPGRLEGIFHFPLPQDASISGFGMWIGNDLIEADVVEKQRAREIYETILRENRDPGLLEWTGGNIFKARVFPIEGRSEKRIKIVYTQVLPLRANRYRYSYGLRSEMLRTKPLRELSLKVTVNSALPLKSIACPTHTVRAQQTAHSGQVEFAAQEYTPTRDFEVVCEIDGKQSDVVAIPHRRGDDGYFLVQLTPPGPEGNWQRELLPDGKPLQLVLLCDTSASMDSEKRKQQAEFVASVLSSLGPDDRFLLGAADVGTAWSSAEPLAPSADNVAKAKAFLDDRVSLGWTNLDRAFGEALKKASAGAQVIYIGDGIVSAGDTDSAAFVQRLGQLVGKTDKQPAEGARPAFHAVTVGNSYESVVMKGIASVGGGSVRTIGGEQTPQVVALELLNEVAQPGLRDINVEFRGLKVAAVYPGRLPNVAAGTQQILVGRYLPEGKDQSGEIIISGQRGPEKVRFVARINLKDAEEGNSFIPRLWARAHLDQLLGQGSSQVVRDDIIRLSEEFHIITPYTSLLVLETDADRERFGVQRRYEMRDGERFFAAGRANANFELLQQQMKRAGDWRLGLRRQVLRSLTNLGRNPQAFQQQVQMLDRLSRLPGVVTSSMTYWDINGPGLAGAPASGPESAAGFGGGEAWFDETRLGRMDYRFKSRLGDLMIDDSLALNEPADFSGKSDFKKDLAEAELAEVVKEEPALLGLRDESGEDRRELDELNDFEVEDKSLRGGEARGSLSVSGRRMSLEKAKYSLDVGFTSAGALFAANKSYNPIGEAFRGSGRYFGYNQPDYTSWVNTLFPAVEPPPSRKIVPTSEPETWTPEAIALSKSLLRTEQLLKLDGGIELSRVTEYQDPRWNRKSGRSSDTALYAPTAWLTRGRNPREQTLVSYCNVDERGVYSLAFLLGRNRASVDSELKTPPLGLSDFSLSRLSLAYPTYTPHIEPAGENRVKLILTLKDSTHVEHFTIDTIRHVLVKREWFNDGQLAGSSTYDDFVEVAGSWWARKIVTTDNKGQTTSETKLDIKALTNEQYAERMGAELAAKPSVQFVRLPFVTLRDARQKVADGGATFEHRLAMILHNAQLQQWEELWKHVDAAEKLAVNKPGVRWLRTQLLVTIRRNEEARQRYLDELKQLAAKPQQDELFLSDHLLGQVYGISSWPEYHEFVQASKPIYERPLKVDGVEIVNPEIKQSWIERLAQSLDAMGRTEEAMALKRGLAEAAPWHLHWQEDYARRLANSGQFDAAHAWLRKELARPERNPSEVESLRSTIADLYRQQTKWAELLKWTTDWIATNPESVSYDSAYSQHLAALIFNDQLDNAYALADQWLKDAQVEGKLTSVQRARLEAALNFANGSLHNLSFYRMDPRWFEPLAQAARFFVRSKLHFEFLQRCVSNHYFVQSDISDRLRGEWLDMLRTELASLAPNQINLLVGWTLSGRMDLAEPLNGRKQLDASEIPGDVWQKIASELLPRWEQAQDKNDKHLLSETLRSIYSTRFADTLLLPFLRQRLATAHPDYRSSYINSLFDALLATKWSEEIEREAFARLKELYKAPEPTRWSDEIEPAEVAILRKLEEARHLGDRLAVEIPALHRLVDAMLTNRITRAEQQLNDQGGQDKLTRQELTAKKAEIRKAAKTGLALHLADEAKKTEGQLAFWVQMEGLTLDIQLEQNFALVEDTCWKILGDAPPKPVAEDDEEASTEDRFADAQAKQAYFEGLLKQRAFTTVMNLAVRKTAAAASIDRVLKYIDAAIAQRPAVPLKVEKPATPEAGAQTQPIPAPAKPEDPAIMWKITKFRMLVALDRPDDLDRELREWIRTDISTGPWRQWLARLVAERGKIDEAIQLFEACEKDKLLSGSDYRTLADWYLVSNRRDAYERSRIEAYKLMPENYLYQMAYQISNRWRYGNALPGELDENTLFLYKALFEKSAQPENYLNQLRDLYAACRDFRLLQMIPDAVLGRTPQQVYSFLQNLQSQVLYEVRNEATADEILARVKKLREGKLTVTDQRALDLMEALVERKSSELLNQPGPHIDACLAALQRAFQRDWSAGEPRMMVHFLMQLGTLPNEKLKTEQLREMRELQKLAPAASRDHLWMTSDTGHILFWSYGAHDEAIREMDAEVTQYVQANDGIFLHQDIEILNRYVAMLEHPNVLRHGIAEAILLKHIAKPQHDEQKKWLKDRLMSVYNLALEHEAAVSIGTTRAKMFDALVANGLKVLAEAPDETARYYVVAHLNMAFDIAHRHKLGATVEVVRKFAFETLPAVLKQQQSQYRNTATTPMRIIAEVLGPKLGLQYVVERMEQYPQRLEIQWDNSWNAFGHELALRRAAAGTTDLDARVLKLAIDRLKRDLRMGEGGNQHIYHLGYEHFWKEKTPDFAKAAEEVLNETRGSGRRAMVVALYLQHGLGLMPRAIEILLIAHKQGTLEESSQEILVRWLHESNRYGEMIPLLEPLIAARPNNINYRTELMVAYHKTQRPEQLAELLQKAHDYFHDGGRWTEGNVAQLARGCLGTDQWEKAKTYFTEAIALHQRANPASGINDNMLSDYYQNLAQVESRLNHTIEAVDAASAAIVCWDARHEHRTHAMNSLKSVLSAAQKLDEYVAYRDAEAAKTGQDSPIVRKVIGQTYQARAEHAKAIAQFKLALQLQSSDTETHQALIAAYDATQNANAATRQLMQLIDLKQHELTLYQQLAERMKDNEPEAERAATSIIESAPNESESHTAMAELRQRQNRWGEAIPHWQQVAELRRLEPTGLLKLAEAQIHEKQWPDAKQTIQKLQRTAWPSRFSDVENQTRRLQEQLPKE